MAGVHAYAQHYYAGQRYSELVKTHSSNPRTLFVDDQFPAADSSLYSGSDTPRHSIPIKWFRPSEICADPKLFVDGTSYDDISQGQLGNCWFVAALSVLAMNQDAMRTVIPDAKQQEEMGFKLGIFKFLFWRMGEWVEVVVDDRLPTTTDERGISLVFAHSQNKQEFWSALLEKAYAKLNKSYQGLEVGSTADALVDFTGGVCETVDLGNHMEQKWDDQRRDQLWNTLNKTAHLGALMSASIPNERDDQMEKETAQGLYISHAYGVLSLKEVRMGHTWMQRMNLRGERVRLVRLRNPWGRGEWTGAWSDGSREWENISDDVKRNIGLKIEDDGGFFMSFEDFCLHFARITICHSPNTSFFSYKQTWRKKLFLSSWSVHDGTAGGCVNYRDTFLTQNHQYLLVLDKPSKAMVALMQNDGRCENELNETIGFLILRSDDNWRYKINKMHDVAGQITYSNAREVFGQFELQEGNYIIVPTTFDPFKERQFLLRVYVNGSFECGKVDEYVPIQRCLEPLPIALFVVKVDKAWELPKQDPVGQGADPYCIIWMDGQKVRTPVRRDTVEPEWRNRYVFFVSSMDSFLTARVYNKNMLLGTRRFMGEVIIKTAEYSTNERVNKPWDVTCPLRKKPSLLGHIQGKAPPTVKGKLRLQVMFMYDLNGN
ncbi:hypothetical protein CBR_g39746 [Chara braunii]|uniref:Calpain catalytic domain-containing protein n=1 Tax=Chara braunii TaxID=69332 RepID=A0A388LSD8_CHABU|nr:hypothetical protein CBR_g39746 [Chara braunii]|eukprot:GBG85181.1 hypothetical protein CBR_g39746 [Chara braunii]